MQSCQPYQSFLILLRIGKLDKPGSRPEASSCHAQSSAGKVREPSMTDSVEVPETAHIQGVANSTKSHGQFGTDQVEDRTSNPPEETEQAIEDGVGGGCDGLGRRTPTPSTKTGQGKIDTGKAKENPGNISACVSKGVASLNTNPPTTKFWLIGRFSRSLPFPKEGSMNFMAGETVGSRNQQQSCGGDAEPGNQYMLSRRRDWSKRSRRV